MTTIELVKKNLRRLEGAYGSDVMRSSRTTDTIFPDWVAGKVFFEADDTELSRREQNEESIVLALQSIRDILGELEVKRLAPALTFDREGRHVILLIIKP